MKDRQSIEKLLFPKWIKLLLYKNSKTFATFLLRRMKKLVLMSLENYFQYVVLS